MPVAIRNFVYPKVNEEAKKRLFMYQLRCSIKTESRDESFETGSPKTRGSETKTSIVRSRDQDRVLQTTSLVSDMEEPKMVCVALREFTVPCNVSGDNW